MTILTLQRRLREAGRIRIGAQVPTGNGNKTRPAKLESFRLTSADKTAIEAAAQLYGGDPHPWEGSPLPGHWELYTDVDAMPVVIPPAASAFSQYMETWSGGGCARRCDGERELLTDSPCMCLTEDEPSCKPTTRLSVILRELPGLGVWRLESHGYYAASELAGTVEVCVQAATRGQLLPAVLRLEQRQVKRQGEPVRKFAVPVLDIQVTPGALGLVVGAAPPAPGLPSGQGAWQPIEPPTPAELGPGQDVGESIRNARTAAPKARKNSAPELPPTGLNPRGAPAEDIPPPPDPEAPPTLSEAQMKKLRALYNDVGVSGAADQKRVTALLLGVDRIGTHSTLTPEQATKVIDRLVAVEAGFLEFVLDDQAQVIGTRDAVSAS